MWTKSGPKKLPPIPIATTSVKGFPVIPTWVGMGRQLDSKVDWGQLNLHSNLSRTCAYPSPISHTISEVFNLVKDFPNIWNHILPITINLLVLWSSQSHMQDSTIFSLIDVQRQGQGQGHSPWATRDIEPESKNIIDVRMRCNRYLVITGKFEQRKVIEDKHVLHWTSPQSSPSALPPASTCKSSEG